MNNIVIYSNHKSNKLQYILNFIFREVFDCNFELTTEDTSNKISISYGKKIGRSLVIYDSGYLDDRPIQSYKLEDHYQFSKETDFNTFDIFSAIFYLITRAEEYGDYIPDTHGRFPSTQSVLNQLDLLQTPIVDRWLKEFKCKLENQIKGEINYKSGFRFISTVDIDQFYAYKHKPLIRWSGSLVRDILHRDWDKVSQRFSKIDPYDTFQDINAIHKRLGIDITYFILTASSGKYDKNISPDSQTFKRKVNDLNEFKLGIHPSYTTFSFAERLKKEKEILTNTSEKKIHISRQHYLRMKLPETYRNLIDLGIKEDYTMGYADQVGFRAGTSYPFYWYDLEKDKKTNLKIIPFQIMDVTLKNYLGLTADKAKTIAKGIIDKIRDVNGVCTIIWHNSSFYNLEGWEGWQDVYTDILEYGKD